jgi:hypothetical protein
MAYKVHTVDGESGEVELDHLQMRTASVVLVTPAAGVYVVERVPVAAIVTAVRAIRTGGTGAVVNAAKNGTDLCSADLSLTTTNWTDGALTATAATKALAVGDSLTCEVVSVAGAPTGLTIQVDYEISVPA